jgi:leucyl-tRNA synthetase
LDRIDWPDHIKAMQRNWIGRSEGVEIDFPVVGLPEQTISVFTTRPDTLFGVTFFILAPEHPLVARLTSAEHQQAVSTYVSQATLRSELERQADICPKTGVFTGVFVINPITGEQIPVWVADYVLMGYGTGAVMGVPAHDQRDLEFARQFNLPVRVVIQPNESNTFNDTIRQTSEMNAESAYTGNGVLVNSGEFSGLSNQEACSHITTWLVMHQHGRRSVQYRMRDWLISRQRYWGAPIPIVHCPKCGIQPVPDEHLPVLLPHMDDFRPDGSGHSPLERRSEFVNTTCPTCGEQAKRETDTMGGFACSSWYFLRYTSPHYHLGPFDPLALQYWAPPDLYVGGAEHAVLHLLYARFWTKVMYDAGLISFDEPFPCLRSQGQLMGLDGLRMSKSRGNVVTPDEVVRTHGADALRIYELFMAPFEADVDWSTEGLNGARRFLNKVWNLIGDTYFASRDHSAQDVELERLQHHTAQQVGERIEKFRFNTMVSILMEFTNALLDRQHRDSWHTATFHNSLETLMLLLAPIAPHLAEELWVLTEHSGSVHQQAWPVFGTEDAPPRTIQVAVQVDGKARSVVEINPEMEPDLVQELVLGLPRVQQFLAARRVQRVIYIPGRIVNIVTDAR